MIYALVFVIEIKVIKLWDMDINLVYDRLLSKLKESNKFDTVIELKDCSLGAATGGEALAAQGFYLKHLKNKDPLTYKIIQNEIEDFLSYCKDVGINLR